jgi:hypothetical protein
MKTSDGEAEQVRFLPYVAIGVKVNLEGWWHPRRHIRKAEGEEYE